MPRRHPLRIIDMETSIFYFIYYGENLAVMGLVWSIEEKEYFF